MAVVAVVLPPALIKGKAKQVWEAYYSFGTCLSRSQSHDEIGCLQYLRVAAY